MGFPKFLRIATSPIAKGYLNESDGAPETSIADEELICILSKSLRFSYEVVSPADGEYGRLLPDGNWTGFVGTVVRGEADLIINQLSITHKRSEVIDFTMPYYIDPLTYATRHPEYLPSSASFIKPFSFDVWIAILSSVLVTMATSYGLYKRKHPRHKTALMAFLRESPETAKDGMLKYCSVISATFLRFFYAALLLSYLMVPSLTGVRTVAVLSAAVAEGSYRCVTFPGVSFANSLLTSDDSDMEKIGQSLSKNKGSTDPEGTLLNSSSSVKTAFISPKTLLLTLKPHYFVSDEAFFIDLLAVGVKKKFCCRSHLDRILNYVSASGIYRKILEDVVFVRSLKVAAQTNTARSEIPLSLRDFQGAFFLLLIGYVCATVLFLLELIFH